MRCLLVNNDLNLLLSDEHQKKFCDIVQNEWQFHGFTGADLTGLCRRIVASSLWRNESDSMIDESDIHSALNSLSRSVTKDEINRVESWTKIY